MDKEILIAILGEIRNQLYFLVHNKNKSIFRPEFREFLPGPSWEEVENRFNRALQQIENDELNWGYVEEVGLTGETAKWKHGILKACIETRVWSRILKMCNSILGSLSGAIPALEFIKEFKDSVEACLRIRKPKATRDDSEQFGSP